MNIKLSLVHILSNNNTNNKKLIKGRQSGIPAAVSLASVSDAVSLMACKNWDTPVVAVCLGVLGSAEEMERNLF